MKSWATKKRAFSRTGPASYKRAKLTTKQSTVRAPASTRQELKRAATAMIPTNTTITATGSLFNFPRVAAGDGDDEREGRAVKVMGIQLVGAVVGNETPVSLLRIVLFTWKQALVFPTIADVLESTGSAAFFGTYNVSHANNYTILKDEIINTSEVGPRSRAFHYEKNVSFIQNYYGPALTETSDKDVWALLISASGTNTVTADAAVTFVDM